MDGLTTLPTTGTSYIRSARETYDVGYFDEAPLFRRPLRPLSPIGTIGAYVGVGVWESPAEGVPILPIP